MPILPCQLTWEKKYSHNGKLIIDFIACSDFQETFYFLENTPRDVLSFLINVIGEADLNWFYTSVHKNRKKQKSCHVRLVANTEKYVRNKRNKRVEYFLCRNLKDEEFSKLTFDSLKDLQTVADLEKNNYRGIYFFYHRTLSGASWVIRKLRKIKCQLTAHRYKCPSTLYSAKT